MLGAVCNTQTHRYLTHVWGDVTVGQGTSVVTAASSDCYSNFHKPSRNGPFLHNEQPPQHPQCPKPPLPGSQAQRGLLNWAGALGGKRHTQAASYLLPSSDRWHFLEGFLIPSPIGCGVTGRTKGCYLKLRRSGRAGEEAGVGACGGGRMSPGSTAVMQSRKKLVEMERTPGEQAPCLTDPESHASRCLGSRRNNEHSEARTAQDPQAG